MRGWLRRASRLTMVGVAATGLGLLVPAAAASASGPGALKSTPTSQPPPLAGPGVTVGHNAEGDLYVLGPSATIKKFCPAGNEDGFICYFTGFDETGIGAAIYRGNNSPPGKCDDVPLPIVVNVDNDTNEVITLGDGTCANKIDVIGTDQPGVDENLGSGGDFWSSS